MFSGNEDGVMKAPGICSDGSSCWHLCAHSASVKRPGSHVKHLRWLHIQLLIVLLAGQASCNQTSTAPVSVTLAAGNAQTLVDYFFDITVFVSGVEKDESDITAWLREVFQNNLQSCVSATTAAPTTPQTTSMTTLMTTTSQNFNTSTAVATTTLNSSSTTTAATTALQDNNTTTAATTTALQDNNTTTAATTTALQDNNTTTAATTTALQSSSTTTAATSTAIQDNNTTTAATTTALQSSSTTTAATSTALQGTSTTTAATSTVLQGTSTTTAATSTAFKTSITTTAATTTAATTTPTTLKSSTTTTTATTTPTTLKSSTTTTAATTTPTTLRSSTTTTAATTTPTTLKSSTTTTAATTTPTTLKSSTTTTAATTTSTTLKNSETTTTTTILLTTAVPPQTIIVTGTLPLPVAIAVASDRGLGQQRKASNSNQSNKARVAREVNDRVARNSVEQATGLVQGLSVSCTQKTAIKNTKCNVMLRLTQRASTCCILRTLCEASKASSDIKAVGGKADIINPLQNACDSNPHEENSCIYNGGASESCEKSAFTVLQSNSSHCDAGKKNSTCSCSASCTGTNAYYAFELSIQDPEITFQHVSSLISKLKDPPNCSTGKDVLCRSPAVASQFKAANVTCRNPTTNLQSCKVILTFTGEVPICNVSAAVSDVLQLEKQISYIRPVTQAAICGNSEVNAAENKVTWKTVNLKPAPFCAAVENSDMFECQNGESLVVLLKQQCDQQFATPGPNATTIQPNTTSSVNVTSSPLNTTANVTATTTPNTTTTTANAEGQANALLELTRDVSRLNSSQVNQLVSQLERLLSGPNVSLSLGNTSVHIVSNLLGASPEVLSESSNRIIGIVDTVGLKLVLDGAAETLLSPDVALSVQPADGSNFQETVFSILNPSDVQLTGGPRLRRSVRADSSIPQGSIRLPASLMQNLSAEEQQLASRVQFNFYQRSTVFQDRSLGQRRLNSGILAASVANLSISGLQDNVVINLRHIEPVPGNFVATCVFWDFSFNAGSGGWNRDGCSVQNSTDNETVCGCTHLTSFAILLDISRTPLTSRVQATILTFITYIGCGISAIFLSITLLTYLAFGKLRKDIPSKILIQLCTALLLLNLVFLVDAWLALYPDAVGLCISTAWFLHYFLLVVFTWMGLEAVHMYLALVKVFNTYISRYMLKFSLVGWGVPMIVVIIVIAIDKDNYGLISYGRFPDGSTDEFCWLKNDIAFYVAVVAYFCVIFLFNLVMFVVVLVQLCRIKRQNPQNSTHRTTLQDVRSVAGITILLGLTWGFAFFAWGDVNLPFMYLFAIFNSLQGFFIFVFHCAVKENVRRQWRTYLCCGRMRLAENSEWSRTATQKNMKNSSVTRLASSRSSKSNNSSSSSFLVTDSSEQISGIGSPLEDRAITADEEPSTDVILNEINRQYRHQQAP